MTHRVGRRRSVTIGRDTASDVALAWDGVSRAHAWLELSDREVITDY